MRTVPNVYTERKIDLAYISANQMSCKDIWFVRQDDWQAEEHVSDALHRDA